MVYKILANTLFMGKKLVYVPECHSTNTLAADLVSRQSAQDGTLVITDRQIQGKGQRGNTWLTEAGLNLTFTIILKPSFLKADQQFFLNMSVSLGVAKYLNSFLPDSVSIKWPNDIMIGSKKVCGILIENVLHKDQIANSIVGIGLNVNQQAFSLPHATSMALATGRQFELDKQLEALVSCIEAYYLLLRQLRFNDLQSEYVNRLFRRAELQAFKIGDQTIEGSIQGVDQVGHLLVDINGTQKKFGLKEIGYIL